MFQPRFLCIPHTRAHAHTEHKHVHTHTLYVTSKLSTPTGKEKALIIYENSSQKGGGGAAAWGVEYSNYYS